MSVATTRVEAAAGPWAAASFCIECGDRTLLFENQVAGRRKAGSSLLLFEPRVWLVGDETGFVEGPDGRRIDDPIAWMRRHHQGVEVDDGFDFVGGLAGYLGFEFGWMLDRPNAEARRPRVPNLWVGVFDVGAIFDHRTRRWTVSGRDDEIVRRYARRLRRAPAAPIVGRSAGDRFDGGVDAEEYRRGVAAAVDAIYAGELFEVNYTERFQGEWDGDRRGLYEGLRRRAPGDFGGLVDVDDVFLASVSPEQFLAVDADGEVVTRPIKGTRPRGENPQKDQRLADELRNSDKDRAENVMIVDLMRNDLTRVCAPGTVEASELCGLYSFESVHHLVSTVRGRLAEECDALDALLAGFPAGSITGAPKLRAMEWIAGREASPRGPYTGSMFYWSDHGRLDSNVLIRTAVLDGEHVEYGSGGAVVADSDPTEEYEEARWKARPFFELLEET